MSNLKHRLFAGFLVLSLPSTIGTLPAQAQMGAAIDFNYFHDQLADAGDWVYSDRWGEVWQPANVDSDWQPYSRGHWVYTDDYGWFWASAEGDWGDVVYHYGRWVNDPDDGWLWIPGYVWSPAWVTWRQSGGYTGWMPMPPDDAFLGVGDASIAVSFGDWRDVGDYFGYSRWYGPRFRDENFSRMWTFVPTGRVAESDYRSFAVAGPQIVNIVHQSTNITNYTIVNNIVINKSVRIDEVQRSAGHPIAVMHAKDVVRRPELITSVDRGRQIQTQMRRTVPRGTGVANSAPRPTPEQTATLSARPITRNGKPSAHLFNKATAAQIVAPGPGASPARAGGRAVDLPGSSPANAASDASERPKPRDRQMPSNIVRPVPDTGQGGSASPPLPQNSSNVTGGPTRLQNREIAPPNNNGAGGTSNMKPRGGDRNLRSPSQGPHPQGANVTSGPNGPAPSVRERAPDQRAKPQAGVIHQGTPPAKGTSTENPKARTEKHDETTKPQ